MTEIESWPASAWLMVRFTTTANRLTTTVGGDTPSRRKTVIPVGESVMLVTDFGHGLVDVAWRKDRYRVFRGDLMLAPSPQIVAHNAVEVQRLTNELRLLREEYDRVLQQKQDLESRLERMTDANGRNLWRADEAELRLDWVKEALTKDVSDVLS